MAVRSTPVTLFALALALALSGCVGRAQTQTQPAAAQKLAVGSMAPQFLYHLSGGSISSKDLHGHPYMLWIMATWCSSCEGGTSVVAQHIAELRARDVRVVQLEAANDLGYRGPPLSAFQRAVGASGASSNWSWGQLTDQQMAVLDPDGYPDIYYLVDRQGRIVDISGAPAATWTRIANFRRVRAEANLYRLYVAL